METQTWLSRHYKFISAENITILSVLSCCMLAPGRAVKLRNAPV